MKCPENLSIKINIYSKTAIFSIRLFSLNFSTDFLFYSSIFQLKWLVTKFSQQIITSDWIPKANNTNLRQIEQQSNGTYWLITSVQCDTIIHTWDDGQFWLEWTLSEWMKKKCCLDHWNSAINLFNFLPHLSVTRNSFRSLFFYFSENMLMAKKRSENRWPLLSFRFGCSFGFFL